MGRLAFLRKLLKYADLLPSVLDAVRRFAAAEDWGAKALAISDLLAILAPLLVEMGQESLGVEALADPSAEQQLIQQVCAAVTPADAAVALVDTSWLVLLLEILPLVLDLLRKARG